MALVTNSAFVGVPGIETLPRARSRMLQHLLAIVKDQMACFEALTGVKIPPSSGAHSITATPHVHDGTTGAIIPIPLAQEWVGAYLDNDGGSSGADYAPVHWPIFWAPAGVTTVRLVVFADSNFPAASRVFSTDEALLTLSGPTNLKAAGDVETWATHARDSAQGGVFFRDLTVTPGEFNTVRIDYFDGDALAGHPVVPARFYGYAVLPWMGPPRQVSAFELSRSNLTDVYVPDVDQHLDGTADQAPFTSFDDSMFADDAAVSSYLIQSIALNEALIWELLNDLPAGANAEAHTNAVRWEAHNHGNGTSYASATAHQLGADIDQPLCSAAFGTIRRYNLSASRLSFDEAGGANWAGRILAPHLTTTGTTAQTLTYVPFRMPGVSATADVQGGSSRLRFAALAYHDSGKGGAFEVQGEIGTEAFSFGSACALAFAGGRELLTGTVDMHGTGAIARAGERLLLRIQLRNSSAPGSVPASALYSVALAYDAA